METSYDTALKFDPKGVRAAAIRRNKKIMATIGGSYPKKLRKKIMKSMMKDPLHTARIERGERGKFIRDSIYKEYTMDKKAELNNIYQTALQNELEKIATGVSTRKLISAVSSRTGIKGDPLNIRRILTGKIGAEKSEIKKYVASTVGKQFPKPQIVPEGGVPTLTRGVGGTWRRAKSKTKEPRLYAEGRVEHIRG